MSKATIFYLIPSRFFVDLFCRDYLFDFLDLMTDFLDFLDLKEQFFRPKHFFRPKN